MRAPLTLSAAFVGLGFATPCAPGQWVSFSEETATRLNLSTVSMSDGEEKDIAVGDFDKDGWTDAIVVRKKPFSNPGARQDVLLMNENGVLVERTDLYAAEFLNPDNFTDARDIQAVDLDGDTWLDLIWANTFGEVPTCYMNLGEDGNGDWLGFEMAPSRIGAITSTSSIKFCGVAVGDVDGQNGPDLFFSNYDGGDDVLMMNDGTGNFADETVARLGSLADVAFATGSEIVDVDNDGDLDIVRCNTLGGPGIQLIFNNGDGTFSNMQNAPDNSAYMFTMGHFNTDDLLDMYVVQDPQDRVNIATSVNPDQSVTYSSWDLQQSPRTDGFGGNIHSADVDNDGDLDIGLAPIDVDIQNCGFSDDFALLQNPGDGHFFDPWPGNQDQNFHVDPHDFAFLDVNNDGCVDIFMGLCTGWRVFIQNNCPVAATLDDFQILFGTLISGGLAELTDSDDQRMRINSQSGFTAFEANLAEVLVGATSPFTSVSDLDLTIESRVDQPGGNATIRMQNWNTGNIVTIGTYALGTSDQVNVFDSINNPNRFVRNADGRVETRLKAVIIATFSLAGFKYDVDQFEVLAAEQ